MPVLFFELVIFATIVYGFWTQIVEPVLYERPLFPLFRSPLKTAEAELRQVNEDVAVAELRRTVRTRRRLVDEDDVPTSSEVIPAEVAVAETATVTVAEQSVEEAPIRKPRVARRRVVVNDEAPVAPKPRKVAIRKSIR